MCNTIPWQMEEVVAVHGLTRLFLGAPGLACVRGTVVRWRVWLFYKLLLEFLQLVAFAIWHISLWCLKFERLSIPQKMAVTLEKIIQLSIHPVKNIFIGVVTLFVAAAVYFLSPILLRRWIYDKEGNSLPPGPSIRYAFLRKHSEFSVDYWAKKYGPLFSIWMGSQLFVVISDPRIARNLLVINGATFSSRKRYFLKNQVILRGRAITASEYGEKW